MKKISIIVPVYNVEKYVERCILSIVSQKVPISEYELIVVSDGSTDRSRDILQKLSEAYPVIQIVDKENGGLSSARNEGLRYATGEYIFFIDSDDWIAEDSLTFLLNWIKKYPVDVLAFNVCEIDDNGNKTYLSSNLAPNDTRFKVEDYLVNFTLRSSACMGLFSRNLFTNWRVKFKEGFLSEDDDFIVHIFSHAKQIVCTDRLIYYYYQRSNSISKGKETELKMISDKLIMQEELDNYIQLFNGRLREGLQRKLNFLAIDIIRLLIRKGHSTDTINKTLKQLKRIGYYPLKKADYGFKYKLFRFAFFFPWAIKCARLVKQYI